MINVKELTDIELNRAMIWLYFDKLTEFCDTELQTDITEPNAFYGDSRIDDGGTFFDVNITHWEEPYTVNFLNGYLSWDLTMPLAIKNNLYVYFKGMTCCGVVDSFAPSNEHQNPLRAICEVLVQIKLEQKQ